MGVVGFAASLRVVTADQAGLRAGDVLLRLQDKSSGAQLPVVCSRQELDKLRGDRDYERMLAEIRNYADKYRQEFGASSF